MAKLNEKDSDLLLGVLDHCDRIHSCVERFGNDYQVYLNDLDYQDSVKMNLFQIGEITNKLSDEFRESVDYIPWHKIYGMRNVIAHGYVELKEETVWNTIQNDIPAIEQKIKLILTESGVDVD